MLTPDDAALVLRRAAELDTPALEDHDALDEEVVRAAAREVGLSHAAVEQAVVEWRAGALAPLPPLPVDRFAGLPGSVAVERRVDLGVEQARAGVEAWLRLQWFELRRRRGDETDWVPRSGVLAAARRAADLDHRLRLSGVGRVRVCAAPAAGGTRLRLVADVTGTRTGLLTGLVAVPAGLTVVGAGVSAVALGVSPQEALLALPAAAGLGGAGWLGARTVLSHRRATLAEELDAVLDGLGRTEPVRPLPDRAAAWARERFGRARENGRRPG